MENIIFLQDSLKEGVFNSMKNFFLYLVTTNKNINNAFIKDAYFFDNSRVVAVNRNTYDKKQRFELQTQFKFRPFSVTQRIFKSILMLAANAKDKIVIKNIGFIDDSIEDTLEYTELQGLLRKNDIDEILKQVNYILNEFDTEIYYLTVSFEGFDFYFDCEGVMDTDAPDKVLKDFVADKVVNNLFLN